MTPALDRFWRHHVADHRRAYVMAGAEVFQAMAAHDLWCGPIRATVEQAREDAARMEDFLGRCGRVDAGSLAMGLRAEGVA